MKQELIPNISLKRANGTPAETLKIRHEKIQILICMKEGNK